MSAIAATEVYRDPVYDGATDPIVVIDDGVWHMFYTQRRASHPDPGPGVSWVHGSRIGVARSTDGVRWTYAGTLEPGDGGLTLDPLGPPADVDVTHWAPEVIFDGTRWRMYLTEIDGIPDRWPGFARTIVEYVSDDLVSWRRVGPLTLASDRVIDAAVAQGPDGRWRLWYKDEAAESVTMVASSPDLGVWRLDGVAIDGRPHEGPFAFPLGGRWWMLTDEWRGMAVYVSDDTVHWQRQGDADAVILDAVVLGTVAGAVGPANHGAVTLVGGVAWLYCFVQPQRAAASIDHAVEAHVAADEESIDNRRCAVVRVQLDVVGGQLTVVS